MKALTGIFAKQILIRNICFCIVALATLVVILVEDCPAQVLDDLDYIIEDFEGSFENNGSYGSLPSNWSISNDSGKVQFDRGTDNHHGAYSLYANAIYHPNEYTSIETVLVGNPGDIVNLNFQVKVVTSGTAEIRVSILELALGIINQHTRYFYDYSADEWVTISANDIEIDPDGEFVVCIGVAHTSVAGSTDANIDCITSDNSNVMIKVDDPTPDPPDDSNGDDDGDNGGIDCFIKTLK
jgi:hypothetical protein